MRESLRRRLRQQPVISVNTKKKELLGNFKNGGTAHFSRIELNADWARVDAQGLRG